MGTLSFELGGIGPVAQDLSQFDIADCARTNQIATHASKTAPQIIILEYFFKILFNGLVQHQARRVFTAEAGNRADRGTFTTFQTSQSVGFLDSRVKFFVHDYSPA